MTLTGSAIVMDPGIGPSSPKANGNAGFNVAFKVHAGLEELSSEVVLVGSG